MSTVDLDQYKKAWDNQPDTIEKLSAVEIYKMSQSKSSSIAKWIFIIGLLEFAFWIGLNLFIPKDYLDIYEKLNLMGFLNAFYYVHYALIVLFLIVFYKNYSSIKCCRQYQNTYQKNTTGTKNSKILRILQSYKLSDCFYHY